MAPILTTGAGSYPTAAAPSTTTWNPADKNANITLSAANLSATFASGSGFQTVRGIASHSTGQFYSEHTITAQATNWLIGIANATESLSSFAGGSTNSIGWNSSGTVFVNGGGVATIAAFSGSTGHVLGMAVDFGNSTIWFRIDGGNWNNSGTANPATNTGGISMAGLAGGPYFPAWSGNNVPDQVTTNFGATAYSFTAPSGFGNW